MADTGFLKDIIGICAGILTTVSFIPQVVRIYKTKSAKDLSLVTFSMFTLGIILWLTYGIMTQALPIILANSVSLVLASMIVAMKARYG